MTSSRAKAKRIAKKYSKTSKKKKQQNPQQQRLQQKEKDENDSQMQVMNQSTMQDGVSGGKYATTHSSMDMKKVLAELLDFPASEPPKRVAESKVDSQMGRRWQSTSDASSRKSNKPPIIAAGHLSSSLAITSDLSFLKGVYVKQSSFQYIPALTWVEMNKLRAPYTISEIGIDMATYKIDKCDRVWPGASGPLKYALGFLTLNDVEARIKWKSRDAVYGPIHPEQIESIANKGALAGIASGDTEDWGADSDTSSDDSE